MTSILLSSACRNRNENYLESVSKLSVETKYLEWANYINLFNNNVFKVKEYKENKDNTILIVIDYIAEFKRDEMYISGYNEILSLISKHNEFVSNNPEYFPDNIDITIRVQNRSESDEIIFKTYISKYLEKININHDATFKYVIFKSNVFPKILKDKAVSFNFENVILDTTYSMNDVLNIESDYYPLSSCENYKNVIIEGHYDFSDYSLIPQMIDKYSSNASVYYYADSNGFFTKIR